MRNLCRLLTGALMTVAMLALPSQVPSAWACGPSTADATAGTGHGAIWVAGQAATEHCDEDAEQVVSGAHLVPVSPVCAVGGTVVCQDPQTCDDGILYNTQLVYDDGRAPTPGSAICIREPDAEAPPKVTPGAVLAAFRKVPLPTPELGASPPGGTTLVNLPTIFYTAAEPFTRQVVVLGRQVRLEIAPVSYEWSVGQGGTFETSWAGQKYRRALDPAANPSAYITWTYADADVTERTGVTVVWGATYSVNGGAELTVPGTVRMTSPVVGLRVLQGQPVLVGS